MNNLSKEKKQQLAFVAMLTVGILIGLWFGLVNAQQGARTAIESRTKEIKGKIQSAEALSKRADEIDEELKTRRGELQERESEMAGTDPFLWFVTLMNQYMSVRPGLDKFETIGISKPADMGMLPNFPYRAITFTVKMNAAYQEFGRFAADFENERPYLRIQNVNMRVATGGMASGIAVSTDEKLDITFDVVGLTLTNALPVAGAK